MSVVCCQIDSTFSCSFIIRNIWWKFITQENQILKSIYIPSNVLFSESHTCSRTWLLNNWATHLLWATANSKSTQQQPTSWQIYGEIFGGNSPKGFAGAIEFPLCNLIHTTNHSNTWHWFSWKSSFSVRYKYKTLQKAAFAFRSISFHASNSFVESKQKSVLYKWNLHTIEIQ